MSVVKPGLSRVNTAAMKMKKLGRWKSHLRIESCVINEIGDIQKRSHAEIEQIQTRAQQKDSKQSLR
jgi:hypothetical protein